MDDTRDHERWLKEKQEALESEIDDAVTGLGERDDQISELETEAEALTEAKKEAEGRLAELEEENAELTTIEQSMQQDKASMLLRIEDLKRRNQDALIQIRELQG